MQPRIQAYATLLSLVLPTLLSAKGDTIRIVIQGSTLTAPIEISDPVVVQRFNVWSDINMDRSRGIAHVPSGIVESYLVSFVTTRSNPGTYVVRYEIDPVTRQGYVFIPGKDDAAYRDNVWLIYRRIEGNWFYASKAWQALADPLILKTVRTASK